MSQTVNSTKQTSTTKTLDMVYIALFAVLIAICSWISIPAAVPFTLQTFAVFISVVILGGKRGTLSIMLYILMGLIGIPVFAGFRAGPSVLLGTTGGYIIGFIFTGLIMWGMEKLFGRKLWILALSMAAGMLVYMTFGTIWFMFVYARNTGAVGLGTVLGWCVIPFLIPDCLKIALALFLGERLRKTALIKS